MSESLATGSTFAGCRLEAIAGRGGMGVVYRAIQLALDRPVALKAIAPELAEDTEYRQRFQRESHLAAMIDHPNVIPVYEAGEFEGTLYLIMRWVQGTDLRAMLTKSGRLEPARALRLLRPVALALAAGNRQGLVHRDVKPANVLIAQGDDHDAEHVYLTDFGIARRISSESAMTSTGMFIGTIDYMAPERIEGDKGGPASDIYAFGCMLFEAVTGHVPFDRPTDVAKIFAHIHDPVPSARAEVSGVTTQIDAIIAKATEKRPEDRFASPGELAVALGRALEELETGERAVAARLKRAEAPNQETKVRPAREATPEPPPELADVSAAPATSPAPPAPPPRASPPPPPAPSAPPRTPAPPPPAVTSRRRPGWFLAALLALPVAAAAVLVAVLVGGGGGGGGGARSSHTTKKGRTLAAGAVEIKATGLKAGTTVHLGGLPAQITAGPHNIWVTLPGSGAVVRISPLTFAATTFPVAGHPTAVVSPGVWVGDSVTHSVVRLSGATAAQFAAAQLPGIPRAIAVNPSNLAAWVADASGAVTHVDAHGKVIGQPAAIKPAATAVDFGEGSVWATNGAAHGLIRIATATIPSTTAFDAGPGPVAVALDQGVWTAHTDGHVTRFNPQSAAVNADIAVAPELDAIAAVEGDRSVWALSRRTSTLYRISNASHPSVTGTVVFGSQPVALTIDRKAVWVATADGAVIQIRF